MTRKEKQTKTKVQHAQVFQISYDTQFLDWVNTKIVVHRASIHDYCWLKKLLLFACCIINCVSSLLRASQSSNCPTTVSSIVFLRFFEPGQSSNCPTTKPAYTIITIVFLIVALQSSFNACCIIAVLDYIWLFYPRFSVILRLLRRFFVSRGSQAI